MIKKDFLQMIDEQFEDFENERNKRKNLKLMIDFMSTNIKTLLSLKLTMTFPKYQLKR